MADEEGGGGAQEAALPVATDEPARAPDPAEQPVAEPAPEEAAAPASEPEEAPAAAAAAVVEKGVLRLRGIPFAANEGNIFQFFEGAEGIQQPVEVYICRRNGRSTGECYVVLPTAEDAASARQQLDKRHIGHRYIEIFEASMPDLEAVRKILEESQPRGHCLRLRGLPFSATAADVIAFMEGVQLAEGNDAIVFTFTSDGRPSGEAYIEVADEAAAAAAMQKHKERMGPRYIEVFASTKHDLLQAAQQAQFQQGQAALRRRWAALNAGGGGPMGPPMGAIPGLGGGGGGPGGMRMMTQGGLAMGGGYGVGPYGGLGGGAGAGAGLGVDSLAQTFEGVSLRGAPQPPGGTYMVAPPEMLQYGGVPVGASVGGMPVPYYLVETGGATYGMAAPDRAPGPQSSLAQQQAAAAAAASQQQQQQQQGLLLAGYSQQGPVYVSAGYGQQGGMVQQQQAPIGPAAAVAQQQQPQQQYVLQQWPQTVDSPIWGYGGGGQATVMGQQVPGPFGFGGQGQAPGQQQQQQQQLPRHPG